MSTVRPETIEKLAAAVKKKGGAIVDCPVGGSTVPATEGKLIGFVGGSAADIARATPILDQMCRRVEPVGPVGSGARMKLAINLPLLVYWQALGEALALIKSLKLDPSRVIDILSDTSGGPNVLKSRGPALAAAMNGKDVKPVTFDVDSIRKDLRTMIEEGRALGVELPVTACALAEFDKASEEGLGAKDASALPARYVQR
jgi:3-hydroxyisobutyrate dehydrogenase